MTEARAGLWVCPSCGSRTRVSEPTEPWECAEDGTEVVYITPKEEALIKASPETVPKEELRELVAEWNSIASQWDTSQTDTFNARCETWESAANRLEELLDD